MELIITWCMYCLCDFVFTTIFSSTRKHSVFLTAPPKKKDSLLPIQPFSGLDSKIPFSLLDN